jgi:AmiR/NasT family two-component response regulator
MDVRLKEPRRYRALLVDAELGRQQFLRSLLEDRGFMVVGSYPSVGELLEIEDAPRADLVILYAGILHALDDVRTTRAANALPMPIGVTTDRFRSAAHSAMASSERMRGLAATAEDLRRELEQRKLVERAKGILMAQRQISEPEAFREIQQVSMQRNIPMPEIARSIIEAKELLG